MRFKTTVELPAPGTYTWRVGENTAFAATIHATPAASAWRVLLVFDDALYNWPYPETIGMWTSTELTVTGKLLWTRHAWTVSMDTRGFNRDHVQLFSTIWWEHLTRLFKEIEKATEERVLKRIGNKPKTAP